MRPMKKRSVSFDRLSALDIRKLSTSWSHGLGLRGADELSLPLALEGLGVTA